MTYPNDYQGQETIRLRIAQLDMTAKLHNIIDLLIEGDPFGSMKKVKIKTLKFLEEMPQIVRLSLSMTSIEDHSYLPILKITSLKYLDLPNDKDLNKDVHHFQKFLD